MLKRQRARYHKDLEKSRKYHRDRYKADPQKFIAKVRKKNFGITQTEYDRMLLAQEGRCAICGRHYSEFKLSLAVDHNHKTKAVRELLCSGCNSGLGFFSDSVEVLEAAIEYLKKHKPK